MELAEPQVNRQRDPFLLKDGVVNEPMAYSVQWSTGAGTLNTCLFEQLNENFGRFYVVKKTKEISEYSQKIL